MSRAGDDVTYDTEGRPDPAGVTEPGSTETASSEQMTPRPVAGTDRRGGVVGLAVWLLVGVFVVIGAALRAWFLFHHPITSDEAIAGLMAQQALHGHLSAFYWGQSYGGVEPYLIALRYAVFGFSPSLLGLVTTLLAVGSGLLTWRVARRLVADPALAALAGAIAWAVPESAMSSTTYEWGFRGVALFCGLLLILLCLRVLDAHQRPWDFAAVGLAAGVGWWSSPEIVYFVLPALVLLIQAFMADKEGEKASRWLRRVIIGVVAAGIGALPWLWANVRSGFASLNQSAYANSPGFTERLRLFFHYSVGMLLSLRGTTSGDWLFRRPLAIALEVGLVGAIAIAVVVGARRGGRNLAIALGVVPFPLLLAFSPASSFWEDGRYIGYVVPLYVLTLTIGCVEVARWLNGGGRHGGETGNGLGRLLAGTLAALLVALTVANFAKFEIPHQSFLAGWGNPNGPTQASLAKLEAAGVRDGYADYWVAYRLDFLSGGKVRLTVIGTDPDRWPALNQEVLDGKAPAWIFVPQTPVGLAQFAGTPLSIGPAAISETQFIADLRRLHVGYRVVNTGLVNAVVPDRAVSPHQVGVPATG